MDSESNILSVDIEKVIRGKSQKLADRLPRCVINYIKKIIHQDEINRLLLENREYTGVEFANGRPLTDGTYSCPIILWEVWTA